jgi:hypothetical protein
MEKREKIFAPKFDPYILEQISQKRKKICRRGLPALQCNGFL